MTIVHNKSGHMAHKCRNMQSVALLVNLVEKQFISMIIEINLVGGSSGQWIDIGVSGRILYDRVMFKTYTSTEDK